MRGLFDEDHRAFAEVARTFVDRAVTPQLEDMIEQRRIDRSVWLEAGAQGLLGLGVPEAYGGSEAGDYRFSAVLTEALASVSAALTSSLSIHYDVVAPYLVELGTEEQKKRWLPGFCTGELVTAIAMTEPSGGSDLAALRTTATPVEGGGWRLNGSKTFITNGYSADLVVVAARTGGPGARGISLFAVEADTPGFRRGRKLDKVGQPEADTAELFFDDLVVGDDALLGEQDRGFHQMMQRLPQERIGAAVSNIAHARSIFDETLDYVRERRAFGTPIGSLQHNKFRVAELVTALDVGQAFVDQCLEAHVRGELSPVTAAKAKWWTADLQNQVIDACVQLYGGYGYMLEYRVARAWTDARVTRIWAGSNEIMKELIGRDLGL